MSSLLGSGSSIQGALPILADAALKGALLVVLAAVAAYALRNRSAASRHAAWTAAVIGHLAIPALVFILPAWRMPMLPAAPWMQASATARSSNAPSATKAISQSDNVATPKASGPVAPATQAQAAASKQATEPGVNLSVTPVAPNPTKTIGAVPVSEGAMLAALWFVGATLVLLRLAVGTWKVNQLARDGARVEDGVWLSLTQRLANRLGVSRPLTLLRGERLAVPVTWGIVYPAVLLPQDADTWSEERRRFVLVHEMAHVKRFDALTQLLAQLAVALFWFDPLVWIAAHQMRVEREHACDDYVLRDGTTPSLYAGELLEMVRSIGTPRHDRAAPAFAALAMARRSEFEGRMLAILDPRLDRKTLPKRGTLMTGVIVALLALPLAALRPFQQPADAEAAIEADGLPTSFKVSFSDASAHASVAAAPASQTVAPSSTEYTAQSKPRYSCDAYPPGTTLVGTHIDAHTSDTEQIVDYLISTPGRCTEAAVVGKAVFSSDETRIARLAPGGFARFRERTTAYDRAVSVIPAPDGSLSYSATVDGRAVPFDAGMVAWLGHLMPEVLREIGLNVPERVARFRAQGGVPAVLNEIRQIHSSGAKTAHYEELIQHGPRLSEADAERIAQQVGTDLASSGDLSAVLQMLPIKAVRSPSTRTAIAKALSHVASSGDKANTLQVMAPNADPELLLILVQAAETLPSSGDKANYLLATAAEYLSSGRESLRNAYFHAASTLQSSGDMANVLISAVPYSHATQQIASQIVEGSKGLASSGDTENVLISLVSQRALSPGNNAAILAAIQRTMTMASSGDRANVLIAIAEADLLTNRELRDAFTKAAMALPSEGDRENVLTVAAKSR